MGFNARLADFADCDFTGAVVSKANFARTCLANAIMVDVDAAGAAFEFADLRGARMKDANFANAVFVGASLKGGTAFACVFREADFYWTGTKSFQMDRCDTENARWPESVEVPHRPRVVGSLEPMPITLSRRTASEAERQELIRKALG